MIKKKVVLKNEPLINTNWFCTWVDKKYKMHGATFEKN